LKYNIAKVAAGIPFSRHANRYEIRALKNLKNEFLPKIRQKGKKYEMYE